MPDTKKTGSRKSTASRKNETEATQPIQIPSQVIDFQKRVLDGQRALFDTAYSAVAAMQDSQESVWNGLLERASFVPERAQEISVAWADTVLISSRCTRISSGFPHEGLFYQRFCCKIAANRHRSGLTNQTRIPT